MHEELEQCEKCEKIEKREDLHGNLIDGFTCDECWLKEEDE